jgi:competence protein ComEA
VPDLSRSELAAYAACAVLVALLGWRALRSDGANRSGTATAVASSGRAATNPSGSPGSSGVTVAAAGGGSATVHVVGAVRHPGVYRLRPGLRVQDAVRRAGGAAAGADLQAINLAARLTDAQQVVVPRRAAVTSVPPGPAPGGGPSGAAGGGAPGAASATGPPISLSSGTAEQLDTLDGVGPATVQKILEYRATHGGFRSVDDLAEVSGIGPKRLEALRARVVP